MGIDLTSAEAKVARAEEHNRVLQDEHAAWSGDGRAYVLVPHADENRTHWTWTLRVDRAPDFKRMALIFGDAIHNLRCAVDHLAYAIGAHQHEGPDRFDPGWDFRFPVTRATCPADFIKTTDHKRLEPVLSPAVLAAVGKVQPYARWDWKAGFSILAVLHHFDNLDKHRISPALYSAPQRAKFSPDPRPFGGAATIAKNCVEDGAEVGSMTVRGFPVDVNPTLHATFAVCLPHKDMPEGASMTGFLNVAIPEVREILRIVSADLS